MMTGCCDDFDTYKQGYQSIRAFSLLMIFSQMRLPMYDVRFIDNVRDAPFLFSS